MACNCSKPRGAELTVQSERRPSRAPALPRSCGRALVRHVSRPRQREGRRPPGRSSLERW
eukprot:6224480-Prymnesium_polylepis.1